MDRQKLSKVVFDQLREREHENRGWQYAVKLRLARWWAPFGALSVWEKSIIAGASLLIVMAVPAVIVAFSSGGGSEDSSVTAPRSTVERSSTPFPTATPYLRTSATPRPIAVGGRPPVGSTPTLSEEPEEPINRQDCAAIKGTPYQSEEERIWYLNNHCDDVQEDDEEPTEEPPTEPPPPPTQPPPPPPEQGLTASQAIALGAQFLGASSGSCSALNNGSYWLITCRIGQETTAACVFEQPPVIDYC